MIGNRDAAITLFHRDRVRAHEELFAHRHGSRTPEFHREIILDWHGAQRLLCEVVFRGGAKSTISEEAVILRACFREFRYCLLLGSSFDRAAERLHAIRREFEKNRDLLALFGDGRSLRGQPWGDDHLELPWGCTIKALGRGQSLRGTKDEIERPDLVVADDIEDRESVRTQESRAKTEVWFLTEVMPAMAPEGKVRVLANMLDPDCLAMKLKNPKTGFDVKVYPWEHLDEAGERVATWGDRFPLDAIDAELARQVSFGRFVEYKQEFLCIADSPEERPFRQEMRRVEPRVRTWEAVYAMIDPARTVQRQSATTGGAVRSWIGGRLVVWDGWAERLMPDQIIAKMFEIEETWHPVKIGFEEDGLNEWALQPIRSEQTKRGAALPLVAVKAPKGKLDFIRGLQPYFAAREVVFAKDIGSSWEQFLGFPGGQIDFPNALAYALHPRLRAGSPIYEDFDGRNVVEECYPTESADWWLCIGAGSTTICAALIQIIDGNLRVFRDWVFEDEPGVAVKELLRQANLETRGRRAKLVAAPHHFDKWNNVGLIQAVSKATGGMEVRVGSDARRGRDEMRSALKRQTRGMAAVLVGHAARYTLNAFAGGYCRAVLKGGMLADFPEDGVYRMLMESLEAFMGLYAGGAVDGGDERLTYATSRDGRSFISARPSR